MLIGINVAKLREGKPSEYLTRFIFGGTLTVIAALIARHYGPILGGLFLAFPGIFAPGLSMTETHAIERKASQGARRHSLRPRRSQRRSRRSLRRRIRPRRLRHHPLARPPHPPPNPHPAVGNRRVASSLGPMLVAPQTLPHLAPRPKNSTSPRKSRHSDPRA